METDQEDEIIIVLSPQHWSHQFISKHHYAIEFSKHHKTFFVSPPQCNFGKFNFKICEIENYGSSLYEIKMTLPIPDWFQFRFNKIFCIINRLALSWCLRKILKKRIKILIDFGCHKSIDRLDKFESYSTVYFPVDDFFDLPINNRGANKLFTVSSRIQYKFLKHNIPIQWINHGLSHVFVEKADEMLISIENSKYEEIMFRKNIGYSGNITSIYIDRDVLLKTIKLLPDMVFHFFGNYYDDDMSSKKFISDLQNLNNVKIYGQLDTIELSEKLFNMDILWLCYKSKDNNYGMENSHKILEYLSTGKPTVSTPIKYLTGNSNGMIYQYENNHHVEIFKELRNKREPNNLLLERIKFSLKYTYRENLKIISRCN